jgi:hypothetical protein
LVPISRGLRDLEFAAARDIQLLALKGPLLASRYYEPAFLRMPSGDLEIAVRECDIEKEYAALMEVGHSPGSLSRERRFSHHVMMRHADRVSLESISVLPMARSGRLWTCS